MSNFVFFIQYALFYHNVSILQFFRKKGTSLYSIYIQGEQNMLVATAKVLEDLNCYLPDDVSVKRIARFFALLSDPSRVKLLSALTISPLCVTDLAAILNMNQTTVSHQLRLLKDLDIVVCERHGKILKYKVANPKINEILLVGVEYLGY